MFSLVWKPLSLYKVLHAHHERMGFEPYYYYGYFRSNHSGSYHRCLLFRLVSGDEQVDEENPRHLDQS
jgi:hypothetical protein